jgi:hypothetical protein
MLIRPQRSRFSLLLLPVPLPTALTRAITPQSICAIIGSLRQLSKPSAVPGPPIETEGGVGRETFASFCHNRQAALSVMIEHGSQMYPTSSVFLWHFFPSARSCGAKRKFICPAVGTPKGPIVFHCGEPTRFRGYFIFGNF